VFLPTPPQFLLLISVDNAPHPSNNNNNNIIIIIIIIFSHKEIGEISYVYLEGTFFHMHEYLS
jgi:hypothetical protein